MDDKSRTAAGRPNCAGTYKGAYSEMIANLHEEKDRVENEIRHEYRKARKYVRSHPEESLAYAFLGGLAAGMVLARLLSR